MGRFILACLVALAVVAMPSIARADQTATQTLEVGIAQGIDDALTYKILQHPGFFEADPIARAFHPQKISTAVAGVFVAALPVELLRHADKARDIYVTVKLSTEGVADSWNAGLVISKRLF